VASTLDDLVHRVEEELEGRHAPLAVDHVVPRDVAGDRDSYTTAPRKWCASIYPAESASAAAMYASATRRTSSQRGAHCSSSFHT
jgi:hypothetical protein